MNTCKSPTHQKYADALEDLDISAGLVAKNLAEARATEDAGYRTIAVMRAMEESKERIDWAMTRLNKATVAVNAHMDSRCRLVR